jgi:hypothetical protein
MLDPESVREKQKASPSLAPGLFLPNDSILNQPNAPTGRRPVVSQTALPQPDERSPTGHSLRNALAPQPGIIVFPRNASAPTTPDTGQHKVCLPRASRNPVLQENEEASEHEHLHISQQ